MTSDGSGQPEVAEDVGGVKLGVSWLALGLAAVGAVSLVGLLTTVVSVPFPPGCGDVDYSLGYLDPPGPIFAWVAIVTGVLAAVVACVGLRRPGHRFIGAALALTCLGIAATAYFVLSHNNFGREILNFIC